MAGNVVKLVFAGDDRDLKRAVNGAQRSLVKFRGTVEATNASIGKGGGLNTSLGGLASNFARVASTGASIGSALPAISSLGALLAQASGAALILPGALAAVGVAGGALALAFFGLKDVLKDVFKAESLDDVNQAIKDLAPSAQDFIRQLYSMKDAFKEVKNAVQGAFFRGLADDLKTLGGNYLPLIQHGLSQVAGELNFTVKSLANFLNQTRTVNLFASLIDKSAVVTRNLGDALAPLADILLTISEVGATLFAELTNNIGAATKDAAAWVRELARSGELMDIMRNGVAAFKTIFNLLSGIASIASNVFGPLLNGASSLQSPLAAIVNTVKEFTAQTQFAEFARNLGSLLSKLAGVVSTLLGAALQALLPVVTQLSELLLKQYDAIAPKLLPALLELVRLAGDLLLALTPLIDAFGSIARELAPLMAEAFAELAPKISEVIGQVAALIKQYAPLLETMIKLAFQIIPPLIDSWVKFVGVVLWVADKILWLGTKFYEFLNAVTGSTDGVVAVIRNLPRLILSALSGIGNLLWGAGQDLVWGFIRGIGSMIGNLANTAANMARSAFDAAKRALGINSPSKLMMEVGVQYGQGFVQGIDATLRNAALAGANLASQTAGATAGAAAATTTPTGGSRGLELRLTGNTRDALAVLIRELVRTGQLDLRSL